MLFAVLTLFLAVLAVFVIPCAVRAAAVEGIKLVGVPQPKLMHGFSPNF